MRTEPRLVDRAGPPVYRWVPAPGVPPVGIVRFDGRSLPPGGPPPDHAHSHEFLLLAWFERGGGTLTVAGREWPLHAGEAYVVAPGEVVGVGRDAAGLRAAHGWGVYFPPEALGEHAPAALLSWRSHPLLLPFVRSPGHAGVHRVVVPAPDRPAWTQHLSRLDAELGERREGHQQAALALLTLVLTDLARLSADVVAGLRLREEPLLARVFDHLEQHYAEPISLRDVARAVGLTPSHLTTVVRRSTGRPVGEWIRERRLTEARRLLLHTDLSVAGVARRVGYPDPAYFSRTFARDHGAPPSAWRRAGRPPPYS